MIAYTQHVMRLSERQRFDATIHTRSDILKPSKKPAPPLQAYMRQLEPGLDYVADVKSVLALNGSTMRLPHGLRCSRLAFSPVVQNAIGSDGRVNGLLVRKIPETLAETEAFFANVCPVDPALWPHLQRLAYYDPHGLAGLIHPIRTQNEPVFRLILSREYSLALKHMPSLEQTPTNNLGFQGRLIDLCVGYGELERCDDLMVGLTEADVDTVAVRRALDDHKTCLEEIRSGSPVGNFLLNLLIDPTLLRASAKICGTPLKTWQAVDRLDSKTFEHLRHSDCFNVFRNVVLGSPPFVRAPGQQRCNSRQLATFYGLTASQLSDVAFLAFGDLFERSRGPHAHSGKSPALGDRAVAIRELSNGLRARHDTVFAKRLVAGRSHEGRSRLQHNHDRGRLMAPQAGMPGHACAIDGLSWLKPKADLPLWKALTTPPPPREWEEQRGIDASARRAFEAMRSVRKNLPRWARGSVKDTSRLVAALATCVGGLSMLPSFTVRVDRLVASVQVLRFKGWLPPKLGTVSKGGEHLLSREFDRHERILHQDVVIKG